MSENVKLIECPRDAMQGIHDFIPTGKKIRYINALLACGFDTIDFGSFVSAKAIPQMRDTAEVLKGLDLSGPSKLLSIIANQRGAEEACQFDEICYLGYPFSVSETFQQRNTNASIIESLKRVEEIQSIALKAGKELVVYLSMAFGNPYGDLWNEAVVIQWARKLSELGIETLALADTTGVSDLEKISNLFTSILRELPNVEIGAHLHTTPDTWKEKVDAAWNAGCRRFDSAIKGLGGCPMASDKLTGNMPTEHVLSFLQEKNVSTGVNEENFQKTVLLASETFPI